MGRVLWVDLSTGKLTDQHLDDEVCRDYIGGYGIGMRLIYDNQKAGLDPLDPESIVAFGTGPLTGSPAVIGSRFTVMGKSPVSGTWGDANSGGYFGPALKRAGYIWCSSKANRRPLCTWPSITAALNSRMRQSYGE